MYSCIICNTCAGQPGFDAGFSVIRTVCEELLLDDPRILPVNRKALLAAITEVMQLVVIIQMIIA
jgi:hypothetical protein